MDISLQNLAIVLYLKFSGSTLKTKDKERTKELIRSANADEYAADVIINKLGTNCKELRALSNFTSLARLQIASITLPYNSRSAYLVPLANWEEILGKVNGFVVQHQELVNKFRQALPGILERRKDTLGDLYSENMNDTVENIVSKFNFEYKVEPVPEANSFDGLLGLPQLEEQLKEDLEEAHNKVMVECVNELKDRVVERVKATEKAMSKFEGKQGQLTEKILNKTRETMHLIKRLNITKDANIKNWVNRVLRAVEKPAEEYRLDPILRMGSAKELNTILVETGNVCEDKVVSSVVEQDNEVYSQVVSAMF